MSSKLQMTPMTPTPPKILLLGTGFGQLPMIEACRANGYICIGVDANPNSVGADLVDTFYHADIIDIQAVVGIARKENITAAVTMQSDAPVPAMGAVNDALQLTGVSYASAMRCCNKDQTRQTLHVLDITQPEFSIATNLESARIAASMIGYPCIIKAPDSSGSRGVSKVHNLEQVDAAFKHAQDHSRSQQIIVETYIDGIEIGAQTFSQDGECIYCFLHNDVLSAGKYMVPIGHSYPFEHANIDVDVVNTHISAALKALGITDGPANVDLIVTAKGDVHIIEIGARIGATCLPELTSIYTGVDWVKLTLDNALGRKHVPTVIKQQACAAYIITAPCDGQLKQVIYPEVDSPKLQHPPVMEVTAQLGESVQRLRKGTDRIGRVVVQADDVTTANEVALHLCRSVQLEVS